MGDYLRIASVYTRRGAVAVWLFLIVCLLASILDKTIQSSALSGLLSRKSYMAMFAYFNAIQLGLLLRDSLAHPWVSLVPRYRAKHLLIAGVIAVFLLGAPMVALNFVGTSDIASTSVVVVFLVCLAAGVWTLHHPVLGFLPIPFLLFVMTPSSASPAIADFLAGKSPLASAALATMSTLSLWMFARRLLVWNEESVDYQVARMWGDLLRGRTLPRQGPVASFGQLSTNTTSGAALRPLGPFRRALSTAGQIESLSGYTKRSLPQRIQLWRIGTQPQRLYASIGYLLVLSFAIMPIAMRLWPGQFTVINFSVQVVMNPFIMWIFWFMRRNRLGTESLRPRSRPQLVGELGLALLWDISGCWLGGILFWFVATAIWAPELLEIRSTILFVIGTGVGQLSAYAIGIWPSRKGILFRLGLGIGAYLSISAWLGVAIENHNRDIANLAIAMLLAAASIATIPLAYRGWCNADLA